MNQAPVLTGAGGSAHVESQVNRKFGFWLFLSSELLIFCGLIGGFLVTKHNAATWPSSANLSIWLVSLNTFLLLSSSLAAELQDEARWVMGAHKGFGGFRGLGVRDRVLLGVEGSGSGG